MAEPSKNIHDPKTFFEEGGGFLGLFDSCWNEVEFQD